MRRAFFMWCVPYCKRRHIASRKAMYCTLKGGLLHCERPPFAMCWHAALYAECDLWYSAGCLMVCRRLPLVWTNTLFRVFLLGV